jgi:hypothetical protein
MTLLRSLSFSLVALGVGIVVAACDEELLDDATFRLWCGDALCAWKLESGHVRKAPTWHENDFGIELVDTPTVISQELKKSARCLVFTTMADVAPSAQVTVGIDFTGDGVVDYEQPIAATGFREVTTQVTAPRSTVLPRLYVGKRGSGRAVLAQLRLRVGNDCSAPTLRLRDRPLGSPCTLGSPSECSSGVCCEGICAECCVKPDGLDLTDDGGAGTPPEVRCRDIATCTRRRVPEADSPFAVAPLQCNPGRRLRASGAVCLADDDCASGECVGASSLAVERPFPFQELPDGGVCPGAEFPDAGGQRCEFTALSEGRCR